MICQVEGCRREVTAITGSRGLELCTEHKYAEEPVKVSEPRAAVPVYVPCAHCGKPTGQLLPPGAETPVVYHAACQQKARAARPNKARRPTENK